jgi:hypothetical protein
MGRLSTEQTVPSICQQALLKRKLLKARAIIKLCNHDCQPIRRLEERFNLASKELNKWLVSIKFTLFKEKRTRLVPGNFVTKRGSKKLVMVFGHRLLVM